MFVCVQPPLPFLADRQLSHMTRNREGVSDLDTDNREAFNFVYRDAAEAKVTCDVWRVTFGV